MDIRDNGTGTIVRNVIEHDRYFSKFERKADGLAEVKYLKPYWQSVSTKHRFRPQCMIRLSAGADNNVCA